MPAGRARDERVARIAPWRRQLYRAVTAAAILAIAVPAFLRLDGCVEGRDRFERSRRHDELARRGMYAGDEAVAPVWLNAYCVVDDRPAYEGYCQREYGGGRRPYCNVKFCRFGEITTTIDGFTGPLDAIALRPKPAGVYRILALGGSTTGSLRWDHIWPGILELLLNAKAETEGLRTRFEVLNDGIMASTSAFSRERYESYGRTFEPDMVIFGQEVNDVCQAFQSTRDASGATQAEVAGAFLAGTAPLERLAGLSPWFARHADDFRAWRDGTGTIGERRERADRRRAQSGRLGTDVCRRAPLDPPLDAPSIFDDYEDGAAFTLGQYQPVLADVAARGGALVVTTAAHDFDHWLCPVPVDCAPLLSGHDWYRYLHRSVNPAIRDFADDHDLLLVDLERALAAHERGEVPFELGAELARAPAELRATLERLAATPPGELRRALFAEEWMHPDPNGYHWVAYEYLRVLWPYLATRVH